VRFVDEPTAVETRFETNGRVRPHRFVWQEAWLDVTDVGRQWLDDAGRHVLVMVAGQQTFELLLERETLIWKVTRAPEERAVA
jgi:hypothetical protein